MYVNVLTAGDRPVTGFERRSTAAEATGPFGEHRVRPVGRSTKPLSWPPGYLIARGLIGEPTARVNLIGGPAKKNS